MSRRQDITGRVTLGGFVRHSPEIRTLTRWSSDRPPTRRSSSRRAPTGSNPQPTARDAANDRRWRRIRRRVGLGYAAALVVLVVTVGVPTDRASLLLVILAGLAIPCLGKGWRAFRQVLLDWLPFTAVLVVYDVSRGLATWVGLPLHMSDIAAADRDLFGGTVPTVWLQDHFLHPGAPTWYDALATLVYITHFLATPIVAAVLWLRNREGLDPVHHPGHRLVGRRPRDLCLLSRGATVVRGAGRRHRAGYPSLIARLAVAAYQPCGQPAQRGSTGGQPRRRDAIAPHGVRHLDRVVRHRPTAVPVAVADRALSRRHGIGSRLPR